MHRAGHSVYLVYNNNKVIKGIKFKNNGAQCRA